MPPKELRNLSTSPKIKNNKRFTWLGGHPLHEGHDNLSWWNLGIQITQAWK